MSQVPLPCPFCGERPDVQPANPEVGGNCWGTVSCENDACPVNPAVDDDIKENDDRGSDAYKTVAIARWNEALLSSDVLARAARLVGRLIEREGRFEVAIEALDHERDRLAQAQQAVVTELGNLKSVLNQHVKGGDSDAR